LLNQTSIQKPSKVARAHERISEAVSRLEKAMNARPTAELSAHPVAEPEAINLKDDTELVALQAEVRRLRQENSALKRVNEQVSARLDAVIGRLNATIGD